MLANLARARAVMTDRGLDAVLLAHPNNFVYATDFPVPSTFSFLDRPFLALLFRDPTIEPVAIVPGWDLPDFRRRSWMKRSIGYAEYRTDRDADLMPSWRAALTSVLTGLNGVAQLGVEERYLPKWILEALVEEVPGMSLVDSTSTIRTIRSVKTPEEIRRLRRAATIMENAVNVMLGSAEDGITEREMGQIYATEVARQGGENIANFVLGFGADSGFSHCIPGDRRLAPGDVIRFDLGARYMGYHADTAVSRFWRHAGERESLLYHAMLDSQREAATMLRPGASVSQIYQKAIEVARRSIPDFRMEHVGHGIGVEHHENPPFTGSSTVLLEPNMVINVETLYLDPIIGGFGIEDTYLITEYGVEQWTHLDRTIQLG
jgi:Xaa-Pro aminopeptidase